MREGRIVKALSGFYYVITADGKTYQCRGRGVFRNQDITPLVGDFVVFEYENPNEGYIMEVKPRRNELVRPPIANISQAIIVTSAKEPDFNLTLLDRFLVLIESKKIKPIIAITKMDLVTVGERTELEHYRDVYENIGYDVEFLSLEDMQEYKELNKYFRDETTVIAGQSGVGKSTILNMVDSSLNLKTAEISTSLGRGRHTTRHVELIELGQGLVADTPGFSSLELDSVEANELTFCFPEFRERMHLCKFRGCLHVQEPNCAVKKAVETDEIATFRYENYKRFLEEISSRKPRY